MKEENGSNKHKSGSNNVSIIRLKNINTYNYILYIAALKDIEPEDLIEEILQEWLARNEFDVNKKLDFPVFQK